MRRTLAGLTAFLAFSGTLLVLPVYAAPQPEAVPVETSSAEVDMGSVADPAPEADVQAGTSDPVAGVPATTPVLTVSREDTDRFSLVGVTWAYDPAVTDTVVQVRVRDGDAAWGAWTEVTVEDADQDEDAAAGAVLRGGTAPLWTGPSTGVEAELVTRSGARPTDVTLDLVDPGTSEADGSLGSPAIQDTADAAMAMPDVYSRAQWGADESIRTWDPEYAPTIRAATLHHTADTNNYTADQVPAMMRSIYRYHTVSRGWGDIGYNVIVDKYGRLWEGRYGGLASTVVGAHAGGFNSGTFGVSMLGNYDTAPTPQVMVDAVSAIIAWKFSLYGVDPAGTVTLTSGGGGTSRYAAGARVTLPTIFGHRDVGSTTCPGQYGYARLGEIRTKVAATLAGATSPIEDRYAGDAALRTQLGAPVGAEQLVSGVWVQSYARGRVYWTAATGAHALWGAILDRYLALGGPAVLGPPTTDHSPAARPDTYLASFRNGTLYWTQSTGARWVKGWVLGKYTGLGGESSVLGFPTSDEVAVPGGV
ncbi:N-acetylmuramoyl-L-alanine amidase, partial [Klenkia brasiliensis]